MKKAIYPALLFSFSFLFFSLKTIPEPSTSQSLANAMTNLLGVKVEANQVGVYEFWRLRAWQGIPSFMAEDVKKGKYKQFIYAEINFEEDFQELIFKAPVMIRKLFKADFIIVVNNNTEEQEWRRCEQQVCGIQGKCQRLSFIINGPCKDECTSDSDCYQPCFYNDCVNGVCQPVLRHLPKCPGQFEYCFGLEDCTQEGTNTTCIQKVCLQHFCDYIYFQINDDEFSCPDDECNDDTDCENSGDIGGILEELAETIGL